MSTRSWIRFAKPIKAQIQAADVEENLGQIKAGDEVERELNLTFSDYRREILRTINKSHVTLISSPTGSGKTTQVPQYILDENNKNKLNIIVSQPRKIAAITIAKRVAEERKCELGSEVGYQVALDKKMDTENYTTRILYCTTGGKSFSDTSFRSVLFILSFSVIIQKLIQDKNMHKFSHIVLDEVHERDVDMDLLLTLVKQLHMDNSMHTKIVLMSATLDEEVFMKYFKYDESIVPGIVKIKANRNFDIKTLYLDNIKLDNMKDDHSKGLPGIHNDTYQAAVKIIKKRLMESQNSILVFLPGIYEIETLRSLLQMDPDFHNSCLICVLHSSLSTTEQQIAFRPANKPKIVLSSNIAESSVTITEPEVDCVVDFCLTKYVNVTDQSKVALRLAWASHESLTQRAGRTGRTCDGTVIRMIFRRFYDHLDTRTTPEMLRIPLETVVLRVKLLDIPPINFLRRAISPPNQNAVVNAVKTLKELGGLQRLRDDGLFDLHDGQLTFVGSIMAALPLDVRVSKFITLGYVFSVLEEVIIICAGLSVKSIFRNSYGKELDHYLRQLSWADGSGCDFMAILNAYRVWCYTKEQGAFSIRENEEAWCRKMNLERRNLHEMRQLILEIKTRLKESNMYSLSGKLAVSWEQKEKPLIIKLCAAGAFLSNMFICGKSSETNEQDIFKTMRDRNPSNTVFLKCKEPVYIGEIYEEQIKKKIIAAGICNNINDIEVEFEKGSSKIFVSFLINQEIDSEDYSCSLSSTSVPGKVAPQLYKAVKVRRMRTKFFLNTMDSKDAETYALQFGLGKMIDGCIFELNKNFYKRPDMVVIPSTCTKELKGVVSHVEHIGKFYIQPKNAQWKLLSQMEAAIEEDEIIQHYENTYDLNEKHVLVYHNKLMRAKVVSVNHKSKKIICYLYDSGETIEFELGFVFKIPKSILNLFDIPPQCFEASLHGIEPAVYKCPRGKWTKEAIKMFKDLVSNKMCNVQVCSVHSEHAFVRLTVDFEDVIKTLIEEGFAREYTETYPHKHNCEVRNHCQSNLSYFFTSQQEFEQKEDRRLKVDIPSPPDYNCGHQIMLFGPTSPLETTVSSILINSSNNPVTVDPCSVNSVLFCEDPGNFYGRLLVSADVSSNRQETVLHQTSLMPSVPGIAEIIAMVFAPSVSFTRDETQSRFTAIRCGLGAYSDGVPFFPDHDFLLPVNVLIDTDDLKLINEFRFILSYILMTLPQFNIPPHTDQKKSELLLKIKTLAIEILSKPRHELPPHFVSPTCNWEIVDPAENEPVKDFFRAGGDYCQLSYLRLNPNVEKAKELLQKHYELVEQMEITKLGTTFSSRTTFHCALCDRNFEDSMSVCIHLNSKMHKNCLEILLEVEAYNQDTQLDSGANITILS